jgi:hypothetical protein
MMDALRITIRRVASDHHLAAAGLLTALGGAAVCVGGVPTDALAAAPTVLDPVSFPDDLFFPDGLFFPDDLFFPDETF